MTKLQKPLSNFSRCIFTARVRSTTEGYSFTLLVCSQGGGGQVSPAEGGVRSSCQGGARSSCRGGGQVQLPGRGQVQLPGGVSPARGGGQIHLGGSQSSWGGSVQPAEGSVSGGVSILHPLAGSMSLVFMQEDFLVQFSLSLFVRICTVPRKCVKFRHTDEQEVLLCECKRHTARHVASTPYVVLTGYPPHPDQAGGVPDLGTPTPGTPWQGIPPGYPLPWYPPPG